jgi:SAM-dependent methyltransferase
MPQAQTSPVKKKQDIATLALRSLRALLKRWGNSSMKQRVWNEEYASGHWNFADKTRVDHASVIDPAFPLVEHYAQSGSVLDLGCGYGSVGFHIGSAYRHYLGIDISDTVIRAAISAVQTDQERAQKTTFK